MEKSALGITFPGKPISVGFVLFVVFVAYVLFYFTFAFIDCCPSLRNNNRLRFAVHHSNNITRSHKVVDTCEGKYIYIHDDLPSEFNRGLLDNCESLSAWVDFCEALKNGGFGPRVNGKSSNKGWYRTNQFSLEVIFHERMRLYECLTRDLSRAAAVFVPYYAGLDVGRHLWGRFDNADRDAPAERLATWITRRPEWRRFSGRDHFFVGGRVAWDFRRSPAAGGGWGSRLMLLEGPANMTMLTIESTTGPGAGKEFAVPYPTFFHPSGARQVAAWQAKMRRARRGHLFAFVGAPRDGTMRSHVIEQCEASPEECRLLRCDKPGTDCENPATVMAALSGSEFCVQPPGDSFTRRSAFESILAGCVPVFFNPASAYEQYSWHFPADPAKYSVYVPEADVRDGNVSVGEVLRKIPEKEVAAMREEVIRMIPRVVYADPAAAATKGFRDAFDIAVHNVLRRIKDFTQGNGTK